ncbi:hypothetical protein [Nonomuraea sp. NPDC049784]|uniref:hypothetical protein n=1 Tax=Nonomuraea sp. NPDC049784 TaxID=3154361 RepID=UPI0033F201F1
MLLRLAYLTVTNTFAALRLLPMSDRDKDVEILALRHQITVLERQLGADTKVRFAAEDQAFLAALLTSLPREVLRLCGAKTRIPLLSWAFAGRSGCSAVLVDHICDAHARR